jgi:MFS family permease
VEKHVKLAGLRLKLIYWFVFVSTSAITPFIGLYYKHTFRKPDGTPMIELIGLLFFIQSILGFFSNPFAGILADKFKVKDRLLFTCSVFLVLGGLLIALPGFPSFLPGNLVLRTGVLILGIVLYGLFSSPVVPILNTETLDFLHNNNLDTRNYGNYRVVGTISWVVATFAIGWILFAVNDLVVTLFIYAGGFVIVAILSLSGIRAKLAPMKLPWHLLKKDRYFQMFLVFVFLQGMGLFSSFSFTSYFMDDLQVNLFFIGLAFSVSAFLEVPVMYKSRQIIQAFGYRKMIIAGTLVLVSKLFLLVFLAPLKVAWLMVLAMSVHGFGFGLQANGMVQLVSERAHKDLRATYMNLNNMFLVASLACGNALNAVVIKFLDSSWMLFINGLITIAALLFFVVVVREKKPVPG